MKTNIVRRAIILIALVTFAISQPVQAAEVGNKANSNASSSDAAAQMLAAWSNYLDGFTPGEVDRWDTFTCLSHWLTAWHDEFGPDGNDPGGMSEGEATDLYMALLYDFGD